MNKQSGFVELVGAGPGDPGLLTIRGRAAVETADVVIYDQLVHPRLMSLVPEAAERIFAGKRAGRLVLTQDQINSLLVEKAREGKHVVRLKGGDPLLFGRGAEEAAFLRAHGIAYRIVPGVTAAVGVSGYAELPITHRDAASAVAFVTGHEDPRTPNGRVDWSALARFPGTLVVYMGVAHLNAICEVLIEHGLSPETPAALVERGTWTRQRSVEATLKTLPAQVDSLKLAPPALHFIGESVRLRHRPSWYESLPLFGRRILVPRPATQCQAAAEHLECLGAEAILAPTVEIHPLNDFTQLDAAIAHLQSFDWLIFASRNGVEGFLGRLWELGQDLRTLARVQIAAIGPGTAEQLANWKIRANLIPEHSRSEGLTDELLPRVKNQRILLARADRGRPYLLDQLSTVAQVEQVTVYHHADSQSLPVAAIQALESGQIDWVTLTSSAITLRLAELLSPLTLTKMGKEIKLATISPITTEAANSLGWAVAAEAQTHTWNGLVDALCQACRPGQD